MKTFLLSGIAAFALMAGVATAQTMPSDTTSSTTSSTTSTAPGVTTFKSSNTERSVDENGTKTDKTQTYSSGNNGTHATSTSHTTGIDGSQYNTSVDKQTTGGDLTTTKHTTSSTTTTTDH